MSTAALSLLVTTIIIGIVIGIVTDGVIAVISPVVLVTTFESYSVLIYTTVYAMQPFDMRGYRS